MNYVSAAEAVSLVKSNSRVFIHGGAATPLLLIEALLQRGGDITNVELVAISTHGAIDWNHPRVTEHFYLNSLFTSDNVRGWVNSAFGEYVPVFLSEIPRLFDTGVLPLDAAIIQVSPPDAHGYCTLGPSADVTVSAVRNASVIIAHVNPSMPRVMGDGVLHISRFAAAVWADTPLPEVDYSAKTDGTAIEIARQVASVVEDGATLQLGIGTIPDAVLKELMHHKHLGLHTEMLSDGVVPLIEQGIIDNSRKKILTGKTISAFVLGTRKVYNFINDNLAFQCLDAGFVNNTNVIAQNPKVTAINSAIEIDLTGQVCADSIGTYQYSGIGGQMDFIRGAAQSERGKPIIALPSVTKDGQSRIVPNLKNGAGVVTTRGHIHYVATEFGIVNLYGKNLEQRASLLISIAHPMHHNALEKAYYDRFGKTLTNSHLLRSRTQ
ncbi:MAG: acetyl-CoA hydrolase/transferase family protein [Chitinophagia bacterium]|nr:acetyl-CoA hydrolase/transferase family protein [Chitinophagia bacterium]